jgi:signal transduction histidine kinase
MSPEEMVEHHDDGIGKFLDGWGGRSTATTSWSRGWTRTARSSSSSPPTIEWETQPGVAHRSLYAACMSGGTIEAKPGTWEHRLAVLARAGTALAGELSLEGVLTTIVRGAAAVTGARYAALGVIGPDETISRFITEGADRETIAAIGHYPTGKGVLGLLIREPHVIRLDDIAEHPASYGFPEHHPPMTTFLGAPVRSGGTVYGNLYLTEKEGGFGADDEQLLLVLAAQAGPAIENALLSERLQSLAVQEERDRISRELHDGVIQTLFSIGMSLESARHLVFTDPERADARLSAGVDGLDGAIRELRNHIFQLRPQQAASLGLSRGLAELAREYEVNALVRPRLVVPPNLDASVPAVFVPDLLQVVRESLANVAKHAEASAVEIVAQVAGGALTLRISDDGRGFTPTLPAVGRGLDNVRERAESLRAELDVRSAPGAGSTLVLVVPLTATGGGEAPPQEGS